MTLTDKLASERRNRLAAERLLELKSRELFEANRKLSQHALMLSDRIVAQREVVREVRSEAAALKDRNVQTQADLERAEAQVETAERRLWDSVETIADGFAVFDQQDRLIAANSAWLALFDYSERIQPGIAYLDILRLAIEDRIVDIGAVSPNDWLGKMLDRWDSADVPEVTIRWRNGRCCRMLDRRSRDGDMVCLALDITSTVQREEELREAHRRAEAASRAKSAFLANMSHELRTPMNGLVAMTDLLLEGELENEQRLYLRTIHSSGEALLRIINDVLDLSRLEAQHIILHPEPFDLERMLHEVLTLMAPMAREKGLDFHVDYDLFLPTRLVGDPGRIRQVLTNLIGNAAKFTEAGHVLIRLVGMEETETDWQVHVTVEDTGIGIDPKMQEHVFASFSQVEEAQNRSFEGTGLGLAISREIVTRMGGEIWVESELGKGSCFGFSMTLPGAEPRRSLPRGLEPGEGHAMLVGCGGDLDQVILSKQLSQLGLHLHRAGSGAEALAMLRAEVRPQIVLIADGLPDTTGPELAEALREAGLTSAIVMLCTDAKRAAAEAVRDSVDATLVRPVLRSDLFQALASLPGRKPPPKGVNRAPDSASSAHQAMDSAARVPNARPDGASAFGAADEVIFRFASGRGASGKDLDRRRSDLPATPGSRPDGLPRPMRVLAAEDNSTNQLVFRKIVKDLDIDLTVAANGQEAVDLFTSFRPDLVFMDISMPVLDGKGATRRIRALEGGTGRVPIVALTAHALSGDRENILDSGLDDYLTKPLRKEQIIDIISSRCPAGCRPVLPPVAAAE